MKHLLIVDDKEEIREILVDVLEEVVDEISQAENGSIALSKIDENPTINCVVSDLSMPVCNGFELLSKMRQQNIDIPTIILTGYDDEKNLARAKELGAIHFIEKNEMGQIVNAVKSIH